MVGKWPQLLRELAPQLEPIAFIYNPTTIPSGFLHSLETVAPSISMQVVQTPIHDASEIDVAIAALGRESGIGLVVLPDIFLISNRAQVIASAAKYRLPAIYPSNLWSKTYGPDTADLFYRAATYVDRILKGERPADLPVQPPSKYEPIINLKTAKALGITVPPTLLARADEVIE